MPKDTQEDKKGGILQGGIFKRATHKLAKRVGAATKTLSTAQEAAKKFIEEGRTQSEFVKYEQKRQLAVFEAICKYTANDQAHQNAQKILISEILKGEINKSLQSSTDPTLNSFLALAINNDHAPVVIETLALYSNSNPELIFDKISQENRDNLVKRYLAQNNNQLIPKEANLSHRSEGPLKAQLKANIPTTAALALDYISDKLALSLMKNTYIPQDTRLVLCLASSYEKRITRSEELREETIKTRLNIQLGDPTPQDIVQALYSPKDPLLKDTLEPEDWELILNWKKLKAEPNLYMQVYNEAFAMKILAIQENIEYAKSMFDRLENPKNLEQLQFYLNALRVCALDAETRGDFNSENLKTLTDKNGFFEQAQKAMDSPTLFQISQRCPEADFSNDGVDKIYSHWCGQVKIDLKAGTKRHEIDVYRELELERAGYKILKSLYKKCAAENNAETVTVNGAEVNINNNLKERVAASIIFNPENFASYQKDQEKDPSIIQTCRNALRDDIKEYKQKLGENLKPVAILDKIILEQYKKCSKDFDGFDNKTREEQERIALEADKKTFTLLLELYDQKNQQDNMNLNKHIVDLATEVIGLDAIYQTVEKGNFVRPPLPWDKANQDKFLGNESLSKSEKWWKRLLNKLRNGFSKAIKDLLEVDVSSSSEFPSKSSSEPMSQATEQKPKRKFFVEGGESHTLFSKFKQIFSGSKRRRDHQKSTELKVSQASQNTDRKTIGRKSQ
ncbi:MAG: hypothetical protein SFT91_05660 [Rickettsiaceae bacterium]|nr:hypothetical protein [Rickettsiaceae bacterium]